MSGSTSPDPRFERCATTTIGLIYGGRGRLGPRIAHDDRGRSADRTESAGQGHTRIRAHKPRYALPRLAGPLVVRT
jgi:hypothetical protein